MVLALSELLGFVGAHEWRRKGVPVAEAGGRIHPHYGVFAPIRSEYVGLVARAPLPGALAHTPVAFDVGTGTGVLTAVLVEKPMKRVVQFEADFVGFDAPDLFLVGYGMDVAHQLRQLPFIGVVEGEA